MVTKVVINQDLVNSSWVDLFPEYEEDFFKELVFSLSYIEHGGSGLGWSCNEVLSLELGEALWYLERLNNERKKEAAAVRRATKR